MTAALLLRLRAPVLTLVAGDVGALVLIDVLNSADDDPMGMIIIALVAIYSAGAHTRGRRLAAATLLVVAATVIAAVADGDSMNVSGFLFFGFLSSGRSSPASSSGSGASASGCSCSERDEQARAAVAEERARIARELHDVVAHAISVIVLQARGRAALTRRRAPRRARGARRDRGDRRAGAGRDAPAARHAARRRRGRRARAAAEPRHLDELVAQVREAGLPVEVRVEGEPPRAAARASTLSAYRIVQEALTNALKHAGPAQARVIVRYGADARRARGRRRRGGRRRTATAAGHGLVGMRERVAVFGGELDEPGRAPDGGFAVRARLPC